MERKHTPLSSVKVVDEAQGIVEAYTNTMGAVDRDNDVIEPTAFDASISTSLPIPALIGHDPNQVVGKVIAARAVPMGGVSKLWTRIQFNMDTVSGREAFSNVRGGYVREWSVGFNLPQGGVRIVREAGKTVRRISSLDWVEVSSVIRGASPGTGTLAAKDFNDVVTTPDTHDASDVATGIEMARIQIARLRLAVAGIDTER